MSYGASVNALLSVEQQRKLMVASGKHGFPSCLASSLYDQMGDNLDSGTCWAFWVDRPEFDLCVSLTSYVTKGKNLSSLNLGFLIYKMGIKVVRIKQDNVYKCLPHKSS